jgi:plasmid stability protein
MKSMTIRGIEPELANKLKEIAKQQGKSVNQIVIEILRKFCGLEKGKRFTQVHHDLDHLFGRWTQEEFERIQGKIDRERKIDPELWQ